MKTYRCGHPRTPENTYYRPENRGRRCAACNRTIALSNYYAAKFGAPKKKFLKGEAGVVAGSQMLLTRLWREHPLIVSHLISLQKSKHVA